MKYNRFILLMIMLSSAWHICYSQVGAEIEVEKPKKYENRKLRAEKTGDKKMTITRKLYHNTTTHYNYYFNANQRLNELVETAKQGFKDDYSQLLPFYNYTLETTSQNKTELDSIVYKCTAGILLHDLRNAWIDNMFLLLAKAYFFRNDLDSAGLTLQYINFAFAPKEAGGYDIPIGSNASNDKGEFSIVSKEKNTIFSKVFSRPPSRNESFIWQIRNFIEKNEFAEAAGIIEILRTDPYFPKRLDKDLHEQLAYWFYKQQVYDSAATHLIIALDNAQSGLEKARWEYLIAQMYQLAKKNDAAATYYKKAMDDTNDPVMDVYARLNALRIQKGVSKDYLQENIDALHAMAKRDKYEGYRDIIYYAAATIELERKNYPNAQKDLLKSVEYTNNNPAQRSQAFLLLGDLNYDQRAYPEAYNFYDSLDINALALTVDKDRVNLRKPPLKVIAENRQAINEQDSLQAMAKMSPAEREAYIKKQAKKAAKDKDAKDDQPATVNTAIKQAPDLFASAAGKDKSNEFYFYNSSLKARGFSEFKAKWGERPNVDNWRRKSAIDRMSARFTDVDDVPDAKDTSAAGTDTAGLSLSNTIPVTQDELDKSNKAITDALMTMGATLINKLEDYGGAIDVYEELLRRFPNTSYKDEALFNLIYAYQKTGDKAKADQYRNQLLTSSPDSKFSQLLKTSETAKTADKVSPATRKYEQIYNLFIEGNFAQAIAEKRVADSVYGKSYWTPQLLFIEAIYYIKQQDDSTAIAVLTDLSTLYPENPMAARAKTMIEVLGRRKEIEEYLTKLEIKKSVDGTITVKENVPPPVIKSQVQPPVTDTPEAKDSVATAPEDSVAPAPEDTMMEEPAPVVVNNYSYVASEQHYVAILLDKVDPVYASEARNAFNRYNKEKFYNQQIEVTSAKVDERYSLVLQGPFTNAAAAMEYIDKIKPFTPSRILPWLSADKYSYLIISPGNLDALKESKDMESYKELLQQALPGKF